MRTTGKKQRLTSGIVDLNGNRIPPDIIDWGDYNKNPVLLYDKENEGHRGVTIGKVSNIERVGNGYVGVLEFMERFEVADIAFEKYSQEVLTFVSIGGFAIGEEKNGVFEAMKYNVREFSLVKFPANMECKTLENANLKADELAAANMIDLEGKQIRYITMSAMIDEAKEETPVAVGAAKVEETAEAETPVEAASVEETVEGETPVAVEASEVEETVEGETPVAVEASGVEETITVVEASNVVADVTGAVDEQEPTQIEAANTPPKGMEWHETNAETNNINIMGKTFKELNADAAFQARLSSISNAYKMGSKAADATPENVQTIREIAASMLQDEKMVILASVCNFTNGVTKERQNGLTYLVECAAGNAAAATLAAADLGIIKWMSLFFNKLFPNDTFRRSVRFVPMSDRTGAIFIESGINAATYVGSNTPVNAPRYLYDDVKRTIERKVFSIQPITFQHSEMAVLAYDKMSTGTSTAMDQLMADISTFWLQVFANTAGVQKVRTTGTTIPTSGLFPIEAPSSNINIKTITLNDLVNVEGAFLMQNYNLDGRRVETVLPARLYSGLAADPEVRNNLTRELSANLGSFINFSATRVTPRNPVARYNTTSNLPELDPALYSDASVNSAGALVPVTPAVTTANHIGCGVSFVENEVIAGIGTIELIVSPEPTYYGTTLSGWVSTGATVARQNGVGVALLVPAVV